MRERERIKREIYKKKYLIKQSRIKKIIIIRNYILKKYIIIKAFPGKKGKIYNSIIKKNYPYKNIKRQLREKNYL